MKWWFETHNLIPGFVSNVMMFDAHLDSSTHYIVASMDRLKDMGREVMDEKDGEDSQV